MVRWITRSPVHIVLIAIAALWLVPTVALLVTSFRPRDDALSTGWWHVFSSHLTLANYSEVIHTGGMGHAFLNSLYITIPATILPLALGAMAAYAFAWTRFPFRDTTFLLIVALMVVPVQTAFVPLLKFFRDHGHLNTEFYGIWLAHTAFGLPLAIFLFRNFFITLPRDLIEAARMDGASEFAVFRRVVIPLSVPALASFITGATVCAGMCQATATAISTAQALASPAGRNHGRSARGRVCRDLRPRWRRPQRRARRRRVRRASDHRCRPERRQTRAGKRSRRLARHRRQ